MAQNQDRLKLQREYIIQLLNQLTTDYRTLKPEMKQIADQYPVPDDEFAFLEEFELLIVNISGYAKQIQTQGSIRQPDVAIAHLCQMQVLTSDAIAQFYQESSQHYPKVQAYLQRLDYLRLLIVEYLQMQQMMQPVSA